MTQLWCEYDSIASEKCQVVWIVVDLACYFHCDALGDSDIRQVIGFSQSYS